MQYAVVLIRHGKTIGNEQGRYVGSRTDESLSERGIKQLDEVRNQYETVCCRYPVVYTGPMKRCMETARILFPDKTIAIAEHLREIDFGEFENKNYEELNGREDYQAWIDSGGKSDYPGGEPLTDFIDRSMKGFWTVLSDMKNRQTEQAAVVCHGGNIMAILSSLTGEEYFDFQIGNGQGYLLQFACKGDQICDLSYHRI